MSWMLKYEGTHYTDADPLPSADRDGEKTLYWAKRLLTSTHGANALCIKMIVAATYFHVALLANCNDHESSVAIALPCV